MSKDKGLRDNAGKSRIDLVPSDVMLHVGKVLEMGAEKYDEHNWENGMAFSKIVASLERHLAKWKAGEDFDDESKLHHADHILCNALFLSRTVRAFPEKDDRFIPFIMNHKRIGLDIDGVIADFATPFCERIGIDGKGNPSWYMSYRARDQKVWELLIKDKNFWLDLKPLIDPDSLIFEPAAYVTSRMIPKEWTEEWLERNGFPCNEVVVVPANGGEHTSKVDEIKKRNIDIFVEDNYDQFVHLNQEGIKCFLQDTYHNKRFKVSGFRIQHPNDVLKYFVGG